MTDGPVVMSFEHDVRVVSLGERPQFLGHGVGVAQVEQTRVPRMRVEDRPLVGVIQVTLTVPYEAIELLPVTGRLTGGVFERHFAQRHHVRLLIGRGP